MVQQLKPSRGGFQRAFGCAWFIREFLAGRGPNGSTKIDIKVGAPQTDIFSAYKEAVIRARAENMVAKVEEKRISRGEAPLNIEAAEELTQSLMARMPLKSTGMRYHSFLNYFGILKRLGFVEATGKTEPSSIQEKHADAPPRVFYRLTEDGAAAGEEVLRDPIKYLYGYSATERSKRTNQRSTQRR